MTTDNPTEDGTYMVTLPPIQVWRRMSNDQRVAHLLRERQAIDIARVASGTMQGCKGESAWRRFVRLMFGGVR